MKKLIMIAVTSAALSVNAQTNFGIQAGASFATMKNEYVDENVDLKTKVGFTAGVLAEIPFGSSINFRPELNFIQKGFKIDETGVEAKETLNYIELAPNFV